MKNLYKNNLGVYPILQTKVHTFPQTKNYLTYIFGRIDENFSISGLGFFKEEAETENC